MNVLELEVLSSCGRSLWVWRGSAGRQSAFGLPTRHTEGTAGLFGPLRFCPSRNRVPLHADTSIQHVFGFFVRIKLTKLFSYF